MTFMNRRQVLKLAPASLLCQPSLLSGALHSATSWQMGLIADLHFGLAPDAQQRLETFMSEVERTQPDCIMQLGDFHFGVEEARPCQRIWEQFRGPRHHVLGNHDMDKAAKQPVMEMWGMPDRFYSFDHRGWHFVILDRNNIHADGKFTPYERANFYVDGRLRGFADPPQLEWLAEDLSKTELPTVIFVHQGLGMPVRANREATGPIEAILSATNQRHPGRIRACFCGHHHVDRYAYRHGLHYLWINSASYYWVGAQFGRMAPYTDPLFTFLTFHADGTIEVAGRESSWASPTPRERGYPNADGLTSIIQQRRLGDGAADG